MFGHVNFHINRWFVNASSEAKWILRNITKHCCVFEACNRYVASFCKLLIYQKHVPLTLESCMAWYILGSGKSPINLRIVIHTARAAKWSPSVFNGNRDCRIGRRMYVWVALAWKYMAANFENLYSEISSSSAGSGMVISSVSRPFSDINRRRFSSKSYLIS